MLRFHCMVCVCVYVCFAWLVYVDGDLALIDPGKPVLERERERRVWSRLEGKLQRESKDDT